MELDATGAAVAAPQAPPGCAQVEGIFRELPIDRRPTGLAVDEELAGLIETSTKKTNDGLAKTARSLQQVAAVLVLVVLVLISFVVGLLLVLNSAADRSIAAIQNVADAIGPDTVSSAVHSLQASLANVEGATANGFELSVDAEQIGHMVLGAVNTTAGLLVETNEAISGLVHDPTMQISLGSHTGAGG